MKNKNNTKEFNYKIEDLDINKLREETNRIKEEKILNEADRLEGDIYSSISKASTSGFFSTTFSSSIAFLTKEEEEYRWDSLSIVGEKLKKKGFSISFESREHYINLKIDWEEE